MVNCKKLKKIAMGFALFLLVACSADVEAEEGVNEGFSSEVVGISGEGKPQIVTVFSIEQEFDFLMVTLMSEDGGMMFIDLSEYLTVMIETNGEINQGTYQDVEENDVIRIYESTPMLIEKIVIMR